MKIAVMGSGAIGGYFGGRLAHAGSDVTFVARGEHLAAIRQDGLRVTSPLGDFIVDPAQATDNPADVGPVDLVLFMVKNYDSEAAADLIRPMMGPESAIVSFQNGVGARQMLSGLFGPERVMAGTAHIPASIAGPGRISHNGQIAKLLFGEMDGARSARAEALEAALAEAGVDHLLADNIETVIWQKFVFLASISALNCMTRLSMGDVLADDDLKALYIDAMKEVVAVAASQGIELPETAVADALALSEGMPPEIKASMLQDLEKGNRLEVRYLSGALAEIGARSGVPTPIHRTAYAVLKPYAEGAAS